MNKIKPDKWYLLGDVFGKGLRNLDDHWSKKDDIIDGILSLLFRGDLSAKFKGSKFSMSFDHESFSVDIFAETDSKIPIYFPSVKPIPDDIKGVFAYSGSLSVRTQNYGELWFGIDPPLEEDITGEFFKYKDIHDRDHDIWDMAKKYRYRLILKSGSDIWVSDAPAIFFKY